MIDCKHHCFMNHCCNSAVVHAESVEKNSEVENADVNVTNEGSTVQALPRTGMNMLGCPM